MSFRSELRDTAAASALEVAKQFGESVAFENVNEASVNVYAIPGSETQERDSEDGIELDRISRTFTIPRQTGFPPTNGIRANAMVTLSGVVYSVNRVEIDSVGAIYKLYCDVEMADQIGVV